MRDILARKKDSEIPSFEFISKIIMKTDSQNKKRNQKFIDKLFDSKRLMPVNKEMFNEDRKLKKFYKRMMSDIKSFGDEESKGGAKD